MSVLGAQIHRLGEKKQIAIGKQPKVLAPAAYSHRKELKSMLRVPHSWASWTTLPSIPRKPGRWWWIPSIVVRQNGSVTVACSWCIESRRGTGAVLEEGGWLLCRAQLGCKASSRLLLLQGKPWKDLFSCSELAKRRSGGLLCCVHNLIGSPIGSSVAIASWMVAGLGFSNSSEGTLL